MNSWYYADATNNRHGPIAETELMRLLAAQQLTWSTLVWREGMADWRPMSDFADSLNAQAASMEGATPQPQAAAPAATVLDLSAGTASTAAAAETSPYSAPSASIVGHGLPSTGGHVVYAGFWKRVAAYLVDGTIVGIIGMIVGGIIGGIFGVGLAMTGAGFGAGGSGGGGTLLMQAVVQLLSLALGVSYFAFFHASSSQATIGKMLIGIKVTRSDGSRISGARGAGRYFALIPSSIILGIGFIMAAFTDRKRALHDMMCDTLVVDKFAFTATPQLQREELGTATIVILVLGGLLLAGLTFLFITLAVIAGSNSLS